MRARCRWFRLLGGLHMAGVSKTPEANGTVRTREELSRGGNGEGEKNIDKNFWSGEYIFIYKVARYEFCPAGGECGLGHVLDLMGRNSGPGDLRSTPPWPVGLAAVISGECGPPEELIKLWLEGWDIQAYCALFGSS